MAQAQSGEAPPEDATLFRLLVDRVLDYAIFLLTPDGHVATWNAGAERVKGYTAKEIIGQSFERFYPAAAREAGRPARLLATALREGRVEDEGWRVRKDGTAFWADVVITALRDDSGHLVGYAKVTRDLSQRRVAEEQLRQSEQRFRTLVDSVKDYAIFLLSPEGRVLTWNQGAQHLKGYAPNEMIGESFSRFYTPEDRVAGLPERLLAQARANGRVEHEGWRVRKDGSRFWADVVITALFDEHGELTGFAKVTRDLSERRQAEQERSLRLAAEQTADRMQRLQAATAALAAARTPHSASLILAQVASEEFHAQAVAVALLTPDASALEIVETCGAAPMAVKAGDQLSPDDASLLAYAYRLNQALFVATRDDLAREHPELAPILARSKLGGWAVVPLALEKQTLGVVGLAFESTRSLGLDERGFLLALADVGAQAIDRARLFESELRARQVAEAAMRTQDEFLSLAAHELRTPVAAVKISAQMAERAISRDQIDTERTTRHLRNISKSSDRLGALIEDLLDVSRLRTGRLELRPKPLDVCQLMDEVVDRYRASQPAHEFTLKCSQSSTTIHADPLRLEQVLDNLFSNAVKYSPSGGLIEISQSSDSSGVTITVTDHGIGLPTGQEEQIFEVFRRAPNAAAQQIQGLGLGLAICRQLIEVHGGRIWATSPGEGHGTTLGIWLPKTDEESGTASELTPDLVSTDHDADRPVRRQKLRD